MSVPKPCRLLDGYNRFRGASQDSEDFSFHRTLNVLLRLMYRLSLVPPLTSTKGSCKPISEGKMAQALGSGLGSCSGDGAVPPEDIPAAMVALPPERPLLQPDPPFGSSVVHSTSSDLKTTRGCLLRHQPASGHLEQPCARAGAVNLLGLCCFHLHSSLIYFFFPF